MMAKARHSRLDCDPACSVEATVSLLEGKWKCVILYQLSGGTMRFNEVRRAIPNVTQRTLTQQLRELEVDGLVGRVIYAQVPPKVEYSLTDCGRSLLPVLKALKEWGDENINLFANRLDASKTAEPSVHKRDQYRDASIGAIAEV